MRVDILSKEYPPAVYGGAGVHVAELVRALRERGDVDVQVRCFGAPRDEAGTTAYADLPELAYGEASEIGEMTCQSSRNGAFCRHNPSGAGFSVARSGYTRF